MPKENTHIFIADKVMESIGDEDIRSVISSNIREYHLGAFFPDVFLYSFKYHSFASRLHGRDGEKTNELIFLMLDSLKDRHDEKGLAFALGYIAHCAADMAFHPMVCHFSGNYYGEDDEKINQVRYRHNRIETYIDLKLGNSSYIDKKTSVRDIRGLLAPALLARMLGKDVKEMKNITRECLRRELILNKAYRCFVAYYLVRFLIWARIIKRMGERGVFYYDVRNEQVLPDEIIYAHPVTGKKLKTTINALVDRSVTLSVSMIEAGLRYYKGKISRKDCENIIDGAGLETGMVGVGFNGMKHFS